MSRRYPRRRPPNLGTAPFVALNGGPEFTFSEAISFQVVCETQDEVDHYWSALGQGGEEGPCGWLERAATGG